VSGSPRGAPRTPRFPDGVPAHPADLIPAAPSGDALHRALAPDHKRDFLVNWHCDPARLVASYMELQERHRDRLIDPPGPAEKRDESAA
jgi:hypothetical protein